MPDHPWRTRRQTPNLNETQFHCDETLGPPEQFNYSRYESLAKDIATFGLHELEGVKGLWEFSDLSYADKVYITKDSMHAGDAMVTDSIRAMIPASAKHSNRTCKPKVITDMLALGLVYPFGNAGGQPPWILNKEDINKVDAKLNHIFCCPQNWIPKRIIKKLGMSLCIPKFIPKNTYCLPQTT